VLAAEGRRIVAVRLSAGHQAHRTALTGVARQAVLRTARRRDLSLIDVPPDGLLLSRRLAERLGVAPGDPVTMQVLEGARPVRTAVVAALSDDVLGFTATMEIGALNRLMREGPTFNAMAIKVDSARAVAVWRRLAAMPAVEVLSVKSVWLRLFEERVMGLIRVSALIIVGFGVLIAIGVVYNIARVSLQERAWELASLRVLGFTRSDVARLLFAELAAIVALGVPLGLVLAQWAVTALLLARSPESFDIPPLIEPATFAVAAGVVIVAALGSAWVVRRRIDRLDLVAVLKTRE
jgi:putative ABC transport system permease protein